MKTIFEKQIFSKNEKTKKISEIDFFIKNENYFAKQINKFYKIDFFYPKNKKRKKRKNYFFKTNKFIKREFIYKNVFIDERRTDFKKLKLF